MVWFLVPGSLIALWLDASGLMAIPATQAICPRKRPCQELLTQQLAVGLIHAPFLATSESQVQACISQRVHVDFQYGIRAQKPYMVWILGSTQRLQCSSFSVMTYFLLMDYILPTKELHSSLWVMPYWQSKKTPGFGQGHESIALALIKAKAGDRSSPDRCEP